MKTLIRITLSIAAAVVTCVGAKAQLQPLEDPNYGATLEERKTNLGNLNWLKDAVDNKDWNTAAGYVRLLLTAAPASHSSLYVYGANTYRNKINRATSVDEKKMLIDSLMLIYDLRAKYFGNHATQGTAWIMEQKATNYAALNQMDGPGVRKLYQEAIDAAGAAVKPGLVLNYFQQLVNGYKAVEVTPEELLAKYEELLPSIEKGTSEEQDSFTGLLATSGAADCGVLEELYTKQLAEKPGDAELLKKAFNLMTLAGCDSPFYLSVGEQYYAAEPSSNVAIRLAMIFEKSEQFDKALQYLNEMIEHENDPAEKANLYVRIAASELGQKRYSNAAQAARQAIALNPGNGYAHMFLANAYLGGQGACSDFNRSAVAWLAYDEFARAREALAGDTTGAIEQVNSQMAGCRANFPSNEDVFMYGYTAGASYSVSCGWISGTTTIRPR